MTFITHVIDYFYAVWKYLFLYYKNALFYRGRIKMKANTATRITLLKMVRKYVQKHSNLTFEINAHQQQKKNLLEIITIMLCNLWGVKQKFKLNW